MSYWIPTQLTIKVETIGEKPVLYDATNKPLTRAKQAGFVKDRSNATNRGTEDGSTDRNDQARERREG